MADHRTQERTDYRTAFPATPMRIAVPPLACDCHTHVFGPYARFPLWPRRSYSPPEASLEDLVKVHAALGIDRVVIVQPTVHGTDNSVTLDAIKQLGPRARGVAVIDDAATEADLAALHEGGVRGVRVEMMTGAEPSREMVDSRIRRIAQRIAPFGWHIQLFAKLPLIASLRTLLSDLPVRICLDHFAWAQAEEGPAQPGFSGLRDLLRGGNALVKLSAPHRISAGGASDPAVAVLARALIEANRDALVWGSDWPHPAPFAKGQTAEDASPLYQIDDALSLNMLSDWAGDEATLRSILVDNPARLYDFP